MSENSAVIPSAYQYFPIFAGFQAFSKGSYFMELRKTLELIYWTPRTFHTSGIYEYLL